MKEFWSEGQSLGACSAQSRAVPFPTALAKSIRQGRAALVSGGKAGASQEMHPVLMGAPLGASLHV